jgi:hypothetical protein
MLKSIEKLAVSDDTKDDVELVVGRLDLDTRQAVIPEFDLRKLLRVDLYLAQEDTTIENLFFA